MQLLKFDNKVLDIDRNTAIGITFSAYDISSPGERKINVSNAFTLPITANNIRIIEHAGNPQFTSKKIYDSFNVDYWIDNYKVVNNGTARIMKIGDRIECTMSERPAIWDNLKQVTWSDFQGDFINYLTSLGLPTVSQRQAGTFDELLTELLTVLKLPFYAGNLAQVDPALDDDSNLYLNIDGGKGGHFAITIKTLFQYIEWKYSMSFGVDETFANNIFNDAFASNILVPVRELSVNFFQGASQEWFIYHDDFNPFLPGNKTVELSNKTLYDCVNAFFKYFNVILDKVGDNYLAYRFDDIDNADIKEMKSNFVGTPVFIPTFDKWKQVNSVKFSNVFEGGDKLINSKQLICKNKNIESGSVDNAILTLDLFHSRRMANINTSDLSRDEAFNTFAFLNEVDNINVTYKCIIDSVEYSSAVRTTKTVLHYSLEDEFNKVAEIIEYPVRYEVKKWLSLNEIYTLRYFRRYFIRQLNGYFFINKISGYNPQSRQPVTIELIKL